MYIDATGPCQKTGLRPHIAVIFLREFLVPIIFGILRNGFSSLYIPFREHSAGALQRRVIVLSAAWKLPCKLFACDDDMSSFA